MKELLYKQIKLAAHPMTFVFIISGVMLLIPNYPYSVSFFYVTLGLFFMFQNAREQHDNDFSALLPIRKRDTVKCAVVFSVLVQLMSIAAAAVFAAISMWGFTGRNNLAGIDANPAVLGIGFLVFTVFNVIFFPSFYRTGYKVGVSFLKSNIGVLLVVVCDVILPHIYAWFDGYSRRQLIFLAVCIVLYAVLTFLSCKKSAELYEKVDL